EAREVAEMLGIPYHVFDCSARYKELVLENFKAEYLAGRTPNPCVRCNQLIKFGMLPEVAKKEGLEFDFFATGHYAKVEQDEHSKRYLLRKGADHFKDQTYFIYRLSQEQLSKVLFPLGTMTKHEVREIAAKINMSWADKDESQDFYSGDYKDLLEVKNESGKIIDRNGNILGLHNGIWNYTIGQRKGLGIAYTEPLYVLELNPEENTVIVGTRPESLHHSFIVNDLTWIAIPHLTRDLGAHVKIRSSQKGSTAILTPIDESSVKVTFDDAHEGITPGQSAVFYIDDLVIGGGNIQSVLQNE
ncbi:MAG: tRNA 2-thiouridine(34) synthase MnmA, partial [Bacteroidota bacterium]